MVYLGLSFLKVLVFTRSRLILTDNTLNNSTGVPSVKLRNPLFFISTPCMVQSEEATNMEQRPCEQKRFFTCQYATFTAIAFGNLTGLAGLSVFPETANFQIHS